MSTRAQVRFATREAGQSFSQHTNAIHAQFYVHSDGYPEHLGVEIAKSLATYQKIMRWEIEELTTKHGDLEYIYYIWQAPNKDTFISIFSGNDLENGMDYYGNGDNFKCIFVGDPEALIKKYSQTKLEQ
jgi:hypothetical protein